MSNEEDEKPAEGLLPQGWLAIDPAQPLAEAYSVPVKEMGKPHKINEGGVYFAKSRTHAVRILDDFRNTTLVGAVVTTQDPREWGEALLTRAYGPTIQRSIPYRDAKGTVVTRVLFITQLTSHATLRVIYKAPDDAFLQEFDDPDPVIDVMLTLHKLSVPSELWNCGCR